MRPAGCTFDTKLDADAWLKGQTSDVDRGMWQPPDKTSGGPVPTLRDYADHWMATRTLRPTTRRKYGSLLKLHILPKLGPARIDRITPTTVRNWHSTMNPKTPVVRAHAYALLRVILATAYEDELIKNNPCRIRGAGQPPAPRQVPGATLSELEVIVRALHERYAALVMLAAWCGLRFGELTELRRKDLDLKDGVVHVTRAVSYITNETGERGGTWHVGLPKSNAGIRVVNIPPHLIPMLQKHLDTYTGPKRDALLWTSVNGAEGAHLAHGTFLDHWEAARAAAGRDDLRFHDLRHTGATLAAASGATIKELMARLGHTSPRAAMIYQEAAQGRDKAIAAALSEVAAAAGNVVPLRKVGT